MSVPRSFPFLLGLLVMACASGCTSIKPPTSQIDPASEVGGLRRGALVYRVYSTSGATSTPDSVRVLSIKYPHPAGRTGYALAEAVVADLNVESEDAKPHWAARLGGFARDTLPGMALGEGIKEAKSLDIPVSRLEAVLGNLAAQGYFRQPNSLPAPVELAVEVNGSQQDKPWRRVAELDQLYSDVRAQGSLVAFRHSATSLAPRHAVQTDPNAFARQAAAELPGRQPTQWSAPAMHPAQPQISRLPHVEDPIFRKGGDSRLSLRERNVCAPLSRSERRH